MPKGRKPKSSVGHTEAVVEHAVFRSTHDANLSADPHSYMVVIRLERKPNFVEQMSLVQSDAFRLWQSLAQTLASQKYGPMEEALRRATRPSAEDVRVMDSGTPDPSASTNCSGRRRRDARAKCSDGLVTSTTLFDCAGEVMRAGATATLRSLHATERVLVQYVHAHVGGICITLRSMGATEEVLDAVRQMALDTVATAVLALQTGHYNLWRDDMTGTALSQIDPTLAGPERPEKAITKHRARRGSS